MLLGWPLSLGDTIALVGALAAVIGAPAAIMATIFAAKAYGFGKRQAERADEQRDYEIMPRLRVRWLGPAEKLGFPAGLSFYNVGGSAPNLVWIGTYAGNLYASWGSLPGHFTDYIPLGAEDLGPIPDDLQVKSRGIDTLALIAQDVYGRWWNCLLDQHASDEPRSYLLEQLQSLGLQDFAGRVYEVGRLDPDALET